MKKDFIVRRTITMIDGKPHVETYSEQELIRCENCKHGTEYGNGTKCEFDGYEYPDDFYCGYGER